jgi:hypothetical protein
MYGPSALLLRVCDVKKRRYRLEVEAGAGPGNGPRGDRCETNPAQGNDPVVPPARAQRLQFKNLGIYPVLCQGSARSEGREFPGEVPPRWRQRTAGAMRTHENGTEGSEWFFFIPTRSDHSYPERGLPGAMDCLGVCRAR